MKALVYEPDAQIAAFLSKDLYSRGIVPVVEPDSSKLLPILTSKQYDIFLTDYSDNKDIINDIIFNLKLDVQMLFIKLYITTPTPERSVLNNLIKLGVSGFIKKPFQEEQFKLSFSTWLEKNRFKNNKRVHVRVKPLPTDNAFAYLDTPYHKETVKFSILDISVGGMAMRAPYFFQSSIPKMFQTEKVISAISVKIRHFEVFLNCEVISVEKNRISFRFTNNEEKNLNFIFRYIADNIS